MFSGPENCAMQSLCLHDLSAEIVHYTISTPNSLVYITHCIIPVVNQPLDILDSLLCSSCSQSPDLSVKIVQSLPAISRVCCMSVLKFALVLTDRLLSIHVSMSRGIECAHLSLSSSGSMASKRSGSKDTYGSAIGAVFERVSTSLLLYEDNKLIIDRDIKLKWQEVNDAFSGIS